MKNVVDLDRFFEKEKREMRGRRRGHPAKGLNIRYFIYFFCAGCYLFIDKDITLKTFVFLFFFLPPSLLLLDEFRKGRERGCSDPISNLTQKIHTHRNRRYLDSLFYCFCSTTTTKHETSSPSLSLSPLLPPKGRNE